MTSGDLDLWDMVTKKNLYNPGDVLNICAKNEGDPTIGLGGVRPQTDRQTHTHKQRTYGYYSIDLLQIESRGTGFDPHTNQCTIEEPVPLWNMSWCHSSMNNIYIKAVTHLIIHHVYAMSLIEVTTILYLTYSTSLRVCRIRHIWASHWEVVYVF